jgi:hypothetical protein
MFLGCVPSINCKGNLPERYKFEGLVVVRKLKFERLEIVSKGALGFIERLFAYGLGS